MAPKRKTPNRKSRKAPKRKPAIAKAKPVLKAVTETVTCEYDQMTGATRCVRQTENVVCTQKAGKVTCKVEK